MSDFEEAFELEKVDANHYRSKHPLKLPMPVARGVYGGNTIAQTLKVAIESSPSNYVPHSFHSFFIAPGKDTIPMEYQVVKIKGDNDDGDLIKKSIRVTQEGETKYIAMVSLIKKGLKFQHPHVQLPPQKLQSQYNPEDVNQLVHTTYIRNAYSDEFVDYKLVPEEKNQMPADRWINVWSGIVETKFKNKMNNYVGLGNLSDSVFLTTLARILHAPWNPTESSPFTEVDLNKDARILMEISLNALHIFHYNAMSLDHHLYFHSCDPEDFNVAEDWLKFSYQARRVLNNRTLVRGYFYNKNGKLVATAVQEGLTLGFKGFESAGSQDLDLGSNLKL